MTLTSTPNRRLYRALILGALLSSVGHLLVLSVAFGLEPFAPFGNRVALIAAFLVGQAGMTIVGQSLRKAIMLLNRM